jgi:hypothetical protein
MVMLYAQDSSHLALRLENIFKSQVTRKYICKIGVDRNNLLPHFEARLQPRKDTSKQYGNGETSRRNARRAAGLLGGS